MRTPSTLSLVGTFLIVLLVIGTLGIVLHIAYRKDNVPVEEEREPELRATAEALRTHHEPSFTQLPEAIPVERAASDNVPALGNVVIKDMNLLRSYEGELVRVNVHNSPPEALTNDAAPSDETSNQGRGLQGVDIMTGPSGQQPVSAESPPTLEDLQPTEEAAFPADLQRGGYVIVECPKGHEELAGEDDGTTAGVAPTQHLSNRRGKTPTPRLEFYRHRSSSAIYGTAQYCHSPFSDFGA
ncbi:hypothetical protein Q4I28_006345 [Leishmania naiffi]|uniref:Uncharacterized protein n=1 Tax=Leishmania naiffi TaxID=5678 RepID=A0AAW3BBY1_9TRYP